jgi:gas vesicle protein
MTESGNPEGVQNAARTPRGRPYRNIPETRSVSMLGIGMVVGAVIGAGIAMLVAPRSGSDTRRQIGRRVGRLRAGRGVWGKLGRELRRAAAARRKEMEIEAKRREIALRKAESGSV